MLFLFNAVEVLWCSKKVHILPFLEKFNFLLRHLRLESPLQLPQSGKQHCLALYLVTQYVTVNLILRGLFLPVAEECFWFLCFVSPCHLEGWLFSARALSFVSQPSYTTEDTGSTGLRSYCSKGKSLYGISPHNSSFW